MKRKILTYLALGLIPVLAIVLAGDELAHHLNAMEAWVANLGPWSILAYVGLFVVGTSLLMPDTVMSIMAGALFGMSRGITVVIIGNLLAAALQYSLSRRFLRDYIRRTIEARPTLAAIQQAVTRNELKLQILLRLTPLNPATLSYLLGSAGVRFRGFLLACLAMFPHQLLGVYFGYAGKHLVRLAGQKAPLAFLHNFALYGGLTVTVIVMILISRTAHKAVMEAVSETAINPEDD